MGFRTIEITKPCEIHIKNKQIALHAYKLEFIQPTTKEKMSFYKKTDYGIWKKYNINNFD